MWFTPLLQGGTLLNSGVSGYGYRSVSIAYLYNPNSSITGTLPVGTQPSDTLIALVTLNNFPSSIPNTPSGWTLLTIPGLSDGPYNDKLFVYKAFGNVTNLTWTLSIPPQRGQVQILAFALRNGTISARAVSALGNTMTAPALIARANDSLLSLFWASSPSAFVNLPQPGGLTVRSNSNTASVSPTLMAATKDGLSAGATNVYTLEDSISSEEKIGAQIILRAPTITFTSVSGKSQYLSPPSYIHTINLAAPAAGEILVLWLTCGDINLVGPLSDNQSGVYVTDSGNSVSKFYRRSTDSATGTLSVSWVSIEFVAYTAFYITGADIAAPFDAASSGSLSLSPSGGPLSITTNSGSALILASITSNSSNFINAVSPPANYFTGDGWGNVYNIISLNDALSAGTKTIQATSSSFYTGAYTAVAYRPVSPEGFYRPATDISTTGWAASTGSVLYDMIDEAVPSDVDYVLSPDLGASAPVPALLNRSATEIGSSGASIFVSSATAGSTFVLLLTKSLFSSNTVSSMTDTAGGTYVKDVSQNGGNAFMEIWRRSAPLASSGGVTITVNVFSGSGTYFCFWYEVSNLSSSPLQNTINTNSNFGTTHSFPIQTLTDNCTVFTLFAATNNSFSNLTSPPTWSSDYFSDPPPQTYGATAGYTTNAGPAATYTEIFTTFNNGGGTLIGAIYKKSPLVVPVATFGLTPAPSGPYVISFRAKRTQTLGQMRIVMKTYDGTPVGTSSWQTITGAFTTYNFAVTTTGTAEQITIEAQP